MKCLLSFTWLFLWSVSLWSQANYPPPFNFRVDTLTLLATWETPKTIIIEEDFEGQQFPPAGWTASSLGVGWQRVSTPGFWYWACPPHAGHYSLANDDVAGWSNNGSMDYLVTPVLDLTAADSYFLCFDSYFDGAYGQRAYVEYSLDSGQTWQLLKQLDASLEWNEQVIDLAEFSGPDGSNSIQFAFHADDYGYFASGWAIDNIFIYSDEIAQEPLDYKIFLETRQIDQITDISYKFFLEYDTTRQCGVVARYDGGVSDTVKQTIYSTYLAEPEYLVASAPDDSVLLQWWTPMVPFNPYNRDPFDLMYLFQSQAQLVEGGCESDGEYVYSVFENSDSVYKYDFYGNIQEKFRIPNNPGLCDLAYIQDEDCFYGAGGTQLIYKMNFKTHAMVSIFVAPIQVRAITYDEHEDAFWGNNWSTDLTLFDLAGNSLATRPLTHFGNFYGLAYDNWTDGGPYLWASSRDSTGRLVVMIDLNSGLEVGFYFDLTPISMNGGLAGGLYAGHNSHFGKIILGGNLQNDVFYGYEINHGASYWFPENLLGFKIYRDDEMIGFQDEFNSSWVPNSYKDYVPECGYYTYKVTGVYDLAPYGYQGDSAESPPSKAVYIGSSYWLDLDFLEDWSEGSFSDHLWFVTDSNWKVSNETGFNAPSALFVTDSISSPYESSLKSWQFFIDPSSTGKIILSFDLLLSSVNASGYEKLQVEVYDFQTESWNPVKSYSNEAGSFGWISDTLDITDFFNGNIFRVRFNTFGQDPSAIEYWAIDNISLLYFCKPPENIEVNLVPATQDTVLVSWEEPQPTLAEWWEWDDGVPYNSIGIPVSKNDWFAYAIRWNPEQLAELRGAILTAIAFIPADGSTFYKIAVWKGQEKELIQLQAAGNLIEGQWNTIFLLEPIQVDITQDLLVGLFFAEYWCCAASTDNGPAIDGYGNLMNLDGEQWQTLLEINPEFDYNWNIKAFFERDSLSVERYEVYRNSDGGPFEFLGNASGLDYLDYDLIWPSTYCYGVKAVYANKACTSGLSEEGCITLTGSQYPDIAIDKETWVYPNPAHDFITFESSDVMEIISLYNYDGRMVFSKEINARNYILPVGDYPNGVYLLRIWTDSGMVSRKIIIMR